MQQRSNASMWRPGPYTAALRQNQIRGAPRNEPRPRTDATRAAGEPRRSRRTDTNRAAGELRQHRQYKAPQVPQENHRQTAPRARTENRQRTTPRVPPGNYRARPSRRNPAAPITDVELGATTTWATALPAPDASAVQTLFAARQGIRL